METPVAVPRERARPARPGTSGSRAAGGCSIRELPRSERPRERLKGLGPQALSAVELLAIVLGSGTGTSSAISVAQAVLGRAEGSLRRLALLPVAALTGVPGVGPARAVAIHAALELGRRLADEGRDEGAPIRSPRDVYHAYVGRLQDLPVEEFHVAVLDAQHRLERDILVTRGILNSSLVHPREVFREAIAERAAAIVLVHNHPSGDPTPSPEDVRLTSAVREAGELLDIELLDHLVIGRADFVSLRERGLGFARRAPQAVAAERAR